MYITRVCMQVPGRVCKRRSIWSRIYVCTHIHTHTHTDTHTYTHTCYISHIHVCMHRYLEAYAKGEASEAVYMYAHTYTSRIYVCTHRHTHTHTHMLYLTHTCMYAQISRGVCKRRSIWSRCTFDGFESDQSYTCDRERWRNARRDWDRRIFATGMCVCVYVCVYIYIYIYVVKEGRGLCDETLLQHTHTYTHTHMHTNIHT
jgi:hypothetical protein